MVTDVAVVVFFAEDRDCQRRLHTAAIPATIAINPTTGRNQGVLSLTAQSKITNTQTMMVTNNRPKSAAAPRGFSLIKRKVPGGMPITQPLPPLSLFSCSSRPNSWSTRAHCVCNLQEKLLTDLSVNFISAVRLGAVPCVGCEVLNLSVSICANLESSFFL